MRIFNHKGIDSLRRGRVSLPGARYFITICTNGRKPGLDRPKVAPCIIDGLCELHCFKDISLHCATVMPDHLHILYTLGQNLALAQIQGKLKSMTKKTLESAELKWQNNFYDHRIREDSYLESFARYIFLNPYCKNLISHTETWPWWELNKNYRPDFFEFLLKGQYPPLEWIHRNETVQVLIEQEFSNM